MADTTFKATVAEFCELDDRIKAVNKQVKDSKVQLKELSDRISDYMSQNSIEVCNAGNYGVLTLKSSLVKGTLNKDCLRDNLCKFISTSGDVSMDNPEQFAETGAEFILNNRPTEIRNTLRRSSTKSKK